MDVRFLGSIILMTNNIKTTLGFFIFPGFPMSCLTSMIEPLRAANEISGTDTFSWRLVGEASAQIPSSAKVNFEPDMQLSDIDSVTDMQHLFLLSGPLAAFQQPSSAGHLREMARRGLVMGGISGGVFPLVRAGLMDGYDCSVHWCYKAAFAAEFSTQSANDDVLVRDRSRFTASGASAAFDMMLLLIEERLGAAVMTEVACWFQHPLVRGEGVRQRMPVGQTAGADDMLPSVVREAIGMFADHIDELISVADVADQLGQSPRQLERLFKKSTGKSPLHFYRMMRMKAARQLVLYSGDTIADIAGAVGYASSTPMVKHYREAFGISPAEERAKVNLFRVQDNTPIPSS